MPAPNLKVPHAPHTYGWLRRPECDRLASLYVWETPEGFLVAVPADCRARDVVNVGRERIAAAAAAKRVPSSTSSDRRKT